MSRLGPSGWRVRPCGSVRGQARCVAHGSLPPVDNFGSPAMGRDTRTLLAKCYLVEILGPASDRDLVFPRARCA